MRKFSRFSSLCSAVDSKRCKSSNFLRHASLFHRLCLDLYLDLNNASAHKNLDMSIYKHIQLKFLPPRTTSLTQPLDQGIIRAFKARYISKLLDHIVGKFEQTNSTHNICKSVSLFDALKWSSESWHEVSDICIENCWRSSGYVRSIGDMPVICLDDEDYEDNLCAKFDSATSIFVDSIDYENYIENIMQRYEESD